MRWELDPTTELECHQHWFPGMHDGAQVGHVLDCWCYPVAEEPRAVPSVEKVGLYPVWATNVPQYLNLAGTIVPATSFL